MQHGDTIAAISTPPGRGGIGIVRLSGPQAAVIALRIFQPQGASSPFEANRARFGRIVDDISGEHVDDAVVTFFAAPHSYTGEDVVEISCHGSPVVLGRVLAIVTRLGARLAEPGEFTFRAFFNRRIDLAQAQSVRDLINAQTTFQARVATRQMSGELSRRLRPFKDEIVEVVVHLESSVEFVEDDIAPETVGSLLDKLDRVIAALDDLAKSFEFGRFVREGFDLAIVGRPNVGKSSIFNRLIGRDRAIVTEIAGTTRDALYESASLFGLPVRLIDTAGIRETEDLVERIGITRSRAAMADADIIILVLDASEPLTDDDIRLLNEVPLEHRILVYNKVDLWGSTRPGFLEDAERQGILAISARTGEGFPRLTETLRQKLGGDRAAERDDLLLTDARPLITGAQLIQPGAERDDLLLTDARQHAAVRRALGHLAEARDLLSEGTHEEIVLLKLRGALDALGEITGETLTEDILNQIFSTFCIGK